MSESHTIDDASLKLLFTEAHTNYFFTDKPVDDALLVKAIDIAKIGPTSFNQSPMRVVFVKSPEAKAKLIDALMDVNKPKTQSAPVAAIIGYDLKFWEHLPYLRPHMDARPFFSGNEAFATESAFRNGTLQGAYLLLALRAVGLDTGPMSGFDSAKVDADFFAGTTFKSNFVVNIGYGDHSKLFPRAPRFSFEQMAKIV
jgi:3-hydroxypropanoate dehydrogenase